MGNSMTNANYDILFVGGGLVGATCAYALADTGLKIAIVEANPKLFEAKPSTQERAIALSQGSRLILEGMGLWKDIEPFATLISKIHVSNKGYFGVARLDAAQQLMYKQVRGFLDL